MNRLLSVLVATLLGVTAFAQPTTQTFNYTGAVQTFTVPPCVTSVTINAKGAQGGIVTGYAPFPQGGLGATMQGDFAVNPGDVLTIVVGQRGMTDPSSSGGGGGSGVNNGSTVLIVAGGGAGVDFQDPNYAGQHAVTTNNGVDGNANPGSGGTGGGVGADWAYTPQNISRGGNGWNAGNNGSTGVSGLSANTTFTAGTWGLGGGGGSVGYGFCNCGGGGGGYSGGGSANINQTGGGGGSYNVGTNQINTAGNNTGNGIVTITYTPGSGPPPAPSGISGTTAVCVGGGPLTYSISPVGGATGYTWSVTGNSSITSGQGTTAIDIQPGTTTATISVTADNACGSSTPSTFVLTIQPTPVIGLGADITQCGGPVTLDANNAGSTYMWSDMSTNQTLVVTMTGTYSVNVTDGNGCFANDTINVTINMNPVIALGVDTSLCGGSILLDGGISGAGYMWSDMSTNQTLMVTMSGTYSVVVTDGNGCTGTDAITVTVNSPPTASAGTLPDFCFSDGPMMLVGSPSGGIWTGPATGGGFFDPSVAGTGTHILTYTVTDSLTGCSSSDTASVYVDICLGINSSTGIEFSVSPNPNNGSFVIDFGTGQSNTTVELVDVTGRVVQTNAVSGSRTTINCETQSSGVYFVRVIANGVTSMQKITIVK